MVTEIQTKGRTAFDEYVARLGSKATAVPEALREGAPVPSTWPYSPEEWEEFAEAARQHLKGKPEYDFVVAIALKGYRPSELATGKLEAGAQINAMSGVVVRPLKPTISSAIEERARRTLRALGDRNLKLDAVLQQNLELAAHGAYTSHPRGAEAAITAAENAISRFDAERTAAAREEAARPVLTVHTPFRGPGGRSYEVGEYRITQAEADGLEESRQKVEAMAQRRGWDHPEGPGREAHVWPPFRIESTP